MWAQWLGFVSGERCAVADSLEIADLFPRGAMVKGLSCEL